MADTLVIIAVGSLVIILALLLVLPRVASKSAGKSPQEKKRPFHCPICGSLLRDGQKLHTVVYKGSRGGRTPGGGDAPTESADGSAGREERIAHVRGCPYCMDSKQRGRVKRVCPVCRQRLSAGDYLIGWIGKKDHRGYMRISGCSLCKPIHL